MAGKPITFGGVADPEKYRAAFKQAQSITIGDSSIEECEFKKGKLVCHIPSPNPNQFVDSHPNGQRDRGEARFNISATFGDKAAYQNALKANDKPISSLSISVDQRDRRGEIRIENVQVKFGKNSSQRVSHVKNFKVADFDGDGKVDIGFELVGVQCGTASLRIYLGTFEKVHRIIKPL